MGSVRQDTSQPYNLVVFDSAAPNPPRLLVPGASSIEKEQAASFDAASGTVSYLGDPVVYYTKDSKLFKVSLRKTDATVPVQVSSLNNVCWIHKIWPSSLGQDTLIDVGVAASPSACDTGSLPDHALTRASAPDSTPAVSLPSRYAVLQELSDPSSPQAQAFVVRDADSNLWLYDKAMAPVGPIVGGDAAYSYFSGNDHPRSSASVHVTVNGELRELSWSATGATLRPSIYRFVGSHSALAPLDAQSYLLVDGLALKRVTNNTVSATQATLDSANGDVVSPKAVTPTHVILQQSSSTNPLVTPSLYSVAKQDLHVQALAASVRGDHPVLGQAGGAVFYKSNTGLRRINVDGSGDRQVIGGVIDRAISMSAPSFSIYTTPALEGVLWCERVGSEANCANGSLKVLNLKASSVTLLGQFSHSSVFYQWSDPTQGYQLTDFPFFTLDTAVVLTPYGQLTPFGATSEELYVARPTVAGSLVQVTSTP